jgi:diguanylate cyclase (GGDEF)-like protein
MTGANGANSTEELQPFRMQRIVALVRRPFRSLPSRIIVSVFAAALVTLLAVTWTSTGSVESVLRGKMDQRFHAILRSTGERLSLWYSQRELDLETFANSSTMVEGMRGLRDGGPSAAAREGVSKYLSYVLDSFSQYETLFVLSPEGEVVLLVGEPFDLTEALRRRLAAVSRSRIGDMNEVGGQRFQLGSAPIRAGPRGPVASLHALVRIGALQEVLRHDDLVRGGVYVVGADGEVLLRSPGAPPLERHARPLPARDAPLTMDEYDQEGGSHVVGSAVRFPRYDWTIVVEQAYEEAFVPNVAIIREVLGLNLAIVVVFGLIAYQMARSIARPIRALSDAAVRIGRGEQDVVIQGLDSDDEIGVLTSTFNEMSSRLQANQRKLDEQRLEIENANSRLVAQNQELQRMNEVFHQLSITDELTRLHNHRFFRDHLPLEIKRSERTNEPLCLILIDIDDFKRLNDRFGHAVGDAVLRKMAEVMTVSTRDMDLLARYGGEEFALLASQTPLKGAVALAEKIRSAISRARFSVVDCEGPKEIQITVSMGVSEYLGDQKVFFNEADRALYRAKSSGKDCVVAGGRQAQQADRG